MLNLLALPYETSMNEQSACCVFAPLVITARWKTEEVRRGAFQEAAEAMFSQDFRGRVLSFTPEAALPYAEFAVSRHAIGRPTSQFDAQIVVIAICHKASIATRNLEDFELCRLEVINPWEI